MSHTVVVHPKRRLVFSSRLSPQVLQEVPNVAWDEPLAALGTSGSTLVGTRGSARGVELVTQEGAIFVRVFTAASAADVELALTIIETLMRKHATTAENEDGVIFESTNDLRDHYDADWVERYVAWGPSALLEAVEDGDDDGAVQLSGPWCDIALATRELTALGHEPGFAGAVVDRLVKSQELARELRLSAKAGKPHSLPKSTMASDVATAVASSFFDEESYDAALLSFAAAYDAGHITNALLMLGLKLSGVAAPTAATSRAKAEALQRATADHDFARELAASAMATMEEKGSKANRAALAIFDVVVELPDLKAGEAHVASLVPTTQQSGHRKVPEQSSWMCNASWAAQADNNGLPVDGARAARYIERCLPWAPQNPAIYFNCACVAFETGDRERALSLISSAAKHGYESMAAIAKEPLLASLRSDPRFALAIAGKLP